MSLDLRRQLSQLDSHKSYLKIAQQRLYEVDTAQPEVVDAAAVFPTSPESPPPSAPVPFGRRVEKGNSEGRFSRGSTRRPPTSLASMKEKSVSTGPDPLRRPLTTEPGPRLPPVASSPPDQAFAVSPVALRTSTALAGPTSPLQRLSYSPTSSFVRSGDVSFIADSWMEGDQPGDIGPSLIPAKYHVTVTSPVIPAGESEKDWSRSGSRGYVKKLFPSFRPTGRYEAQMLTELLDRLLGEVDSSRDPRDIVAETQRIHSIALYEIVRQVSVQCLERGALLKRIWEGYSQQFDSLWKETQVYVDKANADAEAAVGSLKFEVDELRTRNQFLETLVKAKDAELVGVQSTSASTDGFSMMLDNLKAMNRDTQAENARLRAELGRMRTLQATTSSKLKESQLAADQESKHLSSEVLRLTDELSRLQAELAKLRSELGEKNHTSGTSTRTTATSAQLEGSKLGSEDLEVEIQECAQGLDALLRASFPGAAGIPATHSRTKREAEALLASLDRLRGLVTATLSHTGFADDDSGSDVEGRAVTSKAGSRPDLHHTSGVGVLSEQDKHARRTPSHNGSQRSGGGHRNKIGEQVHVGTQTEDAYDDDEEGSIDGEGRKGRREGRTTRNPLHPPPHIVPWPLPTALKNLQAIYTDKLKADTVHDQHHTARLSLYDFLGEWFQMQYGGGTLCQDLKWRFLACALKFRQTNLTFNIFCRLSGLTDPLEQEWTNYYLDMYKYVCEARAMPDDVSIPQKHTWGFMVKHKFLSEVVRDHFHKILEPRSLNHFQTKLLGLCESVGLRGKAYVDHERFLSLCLDERKAMLDRIGKTLMNLFVAGDTNGDGVLDLEEFRCIVHYIDPHTPPDTVARMHTSCRVSDSDSITPDDFVRVCMEFGLLSTHAARSLLHAEFEHEEARSTAELFAELASSWEERKGELEAVLLNIRDVRVRNSLQARLAHFAKLLAAGEEPHIASIARRLAALEILRHSSLATLSTLLASSIQSWGARGGDDPVAAHKDHAPAHGSVLDPKA